MLGNVNFNKAFGSKIKNVRKKEKRSKKKKHCEQHVFLLQYYKINAAFGKKVNIILILKYDSIIY